MKFIYLFIYSACSPQEVNIPEDLKNKTYISILKEHNTFYYPCGEEKYFSKIITKSNELWIDLMETEYFKVNKVEIIDEGYILYFTDRDFYYKITTISKNVLKWEYIYNNIVEESFSYYTTEEDKIKKLTKPLCHYCYTTEYCENLKKWQGAYSFRFGRTHMGESSKGGMRFHINGENSYYSYYSKHLNPDTGEVIDSSKQDNITIKIVKATKDTLELQESDSDIYKIHKNEQGNFNVSGHPIYMLSPPNESYLLTKEK